MKKNFCILSALIISLFLTTPLHLLAYSYYGAVGGNATLISHQADVYKNVIKKQNNIIQESYNPLFKKWSPLPLREIRKQLISANGRALVSFLSFEDRIRFQEAVKEYQFEGLKVEKVYHSFPALVIDYLLNSISFDLSVFGIKYIYPIGSFSFTIPQNINMTLGNLVELHEVRKALEIDKIHQAGFWGYNITVAVMDSGMNVTRSPSLNSLMHYDEPKVIYDWNAVPIEGNDDYSGHGTLIASILAGNGRFIENGKVVSTNDYGILPDAKLYNIKVLDKTGYGKDEWIIDGFDKALELNPDIISASITSITFAAIGDPIEELVYQAAKKGIIVVSSAGNYGPTGNSVGSPAIWDYVISVGATKDMENLAVFSSMGLTLEKTPAVDILALGYAIGGSDGFTGGKRYVSGTSASAPIISGIIGLLKEAFPSQSIYRYEVALFSTAQKLNLPEIAQGSGVVNPWAAYNYLKTNKNKEVFSVYPTKFHPINRYYYLCVEGDKKTFNLKLISSASLQINVSVTGNSEFIEIPSAFNVSYGWNTISFNISIPFGTPFRNINSKITLTSNNATIEEITIDLQTRYYGGSILFDISHDNDTENKWFDSSTPYAAHSELSRILMDRGFHVSFSNGTLNLTNVDILVISDPELPFSGEEINKIYSFVENGGSLLFLVNNLRVSLGGAIEDDPVLSSNYTVCEKVLEPINVSIGYYLPIDFVPHYAVPAAKQSILSAEKFTYWGWPIKFENADEGEILAYFEAKMGDKLYNFPAVLAKEYGKGRIMVFGSGYAFTDQGLLPDVFEISVLTANLTKSYKKYFEIDSENSKIVNETFSWLINKYRPKFEISLNPEHIYLREPFTLSIKVYTNTNTLYLKNNNLTGVILFQNTTFREITLFKNPHTFSYDISLKFDAYGLYILFLPLKLEGHTPTDGRIELFCDVELWDMLPLIQHWAGIVTFVLIAAIVITPVIRMRFRKIEAGNS